MNIAKKIGIIISFMITLIIACGFSLVYWIKADDLVTLLTHQLQGKTGIELSVEHAHWSFFPRLGIELNEVNLYHPEAGTLAHLDKLETQVALLPLLHKQVSISEIHVIRPHLQLTQNTHGQLNWNLLIESIQSLKNEPEKNKTNLDITLNKITLSEGKLEYQDLIKKTHYEFNELNFTGEAIQLNKAFPLKLSLKFQSSQESTVTLSGQLLADPKKQFYQLEKAQLKTHITLAHAPKQTLLFKSPTIQLDLAQHSIQANRIYFSADGFSGDLNNVKITQLTKEPHLSGDLEFIIPQLRSLLEEWNISILNQARPEQLQKTTVTAQLNASKTGIQLSHIQSLLDQSHIHGNLTLENFAQPAIHAQLYVDQLNLDAYMPPAASINSDEENSDENNNPLLPIEPLKRVNIESQIHIENLTARRMAIEQFNLQTSAHQGLWYFSHCNGKVLQGRFNCSVSLSVQDAEPTFIVHNSMSDIQVGLLMRSFSQSDAFNGLLDFDGQIASHGNTKSLVLKNLSGNSELKIRQGMIKGINIAQLVFDQLTQFGPVIQNYLMEKAQPKIPPAFKKDTLLTTFSTQVQFKNGIAHLQHINTQLDKAHARGNADINLLNKTLDLHFNVQLDASISNAYIAKIIWPVHCSGPLNSAPQCTVESGPIRKQLEKLAQHALEEKAKKALLKKFNLADEAAAKAAIQQKIQEQKARLKEQENRLKQKEDAAKEQLQQELQNKLRGLFR